ncbi:ABC transporter substrate-binding protein [Solicola gregarius]|uniref:Extracellular solute-binding protein n=1 Tax=Solicola gregarius TaxID=2908642 RepID=A0AA46TLR7_9ACTN|nr:extracellular solute-binding protein [Solicola gregarius]UYM06758.1 extracellular solute-binding protein [Solicola gregarius]
MSGTRRQIGRVIATGGVVLALATAAACAPGDDGGSGTETKKEDVNTDISGVGDVTLTVWDQEVRGEQSKVMDQLNTAFEQKYPNVKIERVSKSFADLRKTLRLAITNDEPPDVVQANNGRSDMGQFVKAGLLQSLDGYAEAYGWADRFPDSVRALASYTDDGSTFGEGNLYGVPQLGEMVGLWYNKAKLAKLKVDPPKTTEEFEKVLQAAKDAGEVPIQYGDLDAWPGIHMFGFVQNQFVPRDDIRTLGFGREGGSWESDENVETAQTLADWADKGYFSDDFNGLGSDPAWQNFAKGKGVFLVQGTWMLAEDLVPALGDDLGFMLPPVGPSGEQTVTGGTGLPYAVTDASDNADVAAAYIDFITNEDAMKMMADAGQLPVVDSDQANVSGVRAEVFDAWNQVNSDDALVPYLDYATPDFYDTLTGNVQKLTAGDESPDDFLAALEEDYSGFVSENSGG